MSKFYSFFIHTGAIATIIMTWLVLRLANYDWTVLFWFVPLMLFIEFGCFASRDKKHGK